MSLLYTALQQLCNDGCCVSFYNSFGGDDKEVMSSTL